ncbi:DUF3574 domain-containing protein [Luteimonas deserti]|uniref:DUF3574 domain-containing protein n=1 Tax=Luteimonas deserti TaxID=2752306 RepID=A0A7Z0QPB7_9GAMM|nr:DUF3574 domain-containing protein [Luteimonas deserti]NYZ62349.1 DUF3574 domain-containing protein [Luteimonas deserti]
MAPVRVPTLPRAGVLVLVAALAGCTGVPVREPVTAAYHGDAARPAAGDGWLRTELYFATGRWEADDAERIADEQRWLAFLDREVTPRFPQGLSVIDVYGQWLPEGATTPTRLRSKELVVLHADTPEASDAIDAIRAAWKRDTGHRSVLRSQLSARVSF